MTADKVAAAVAETQQRLQVRCSNPSCTEHVQKRQRNVRTWADKPCGVCGSKVERVTGLDLEQVQLEPKPLAREAELVALGAPTFRPVPHELSEPVRVSTRALRLLEERSRRPAATRLEPHEFAGQVVSAFAEAVDGKPLELERLIEAARS